MPALVLAELRSIDVTRLGAPLSAGLLDHAPGADAAAVVAPIVGEGIALGAFQRARSTVDTAPLEGSGASLVRRGTGGPALRVGRGQLLVSIDLRAPEVLGGVADPARALNRHVRPLLRALTSLSDVAATSGGRDLILARGEPIAWVGVRHHRASRRTGLEAVINLSRGFALDPAIDLAHGAIERWNGRAPRTLHEVLGREVATAEVVEAIARELAVVAGGSVETFAPPALPHVRVNPDEAPFTAMIEESIGLLGAVVEGRRVTIGGDWMVSADVAEELSYRLFGCDAQAMGAVIDDLLAPGSGAMLLGVRSLDSIRKVALAAIEADKTQNARG